MRFRRLKNRVIALLGLVALTGLHPPAARAATDATLSVRPFSGVPPSAVNDLTLSATGVEGQLQLTWTAPTVFAGTTLDAYEVRVQTFSLASVAGSTTTWWNNATGFVAQGYYSETPGSTVTRTLGPPGSSHVAPLYPGGLYYVAVRSADDQGTLIDLWSTIVMSPSGTPLDITPSVPIGLGAVTSSSTVTLTWTDLSASEKTVDFDRYRVYRSLQSGSGFALIGTATTAAYVDSTVSTGGTYFYRITALDRGAPLFPGTALESAPSAELSVTVTGSATSGAPRHPNGVLGTLSSGNQFTLSWHAVSLDVNGQSTTIDHYEIERYVQLGSTAVYTASVLGSTLNYSETVGVVTNYYRVRAISTGGLTSAWSDYVDSSVDTNRYAIASDDIETRFVMPRTVALELLSGNNLYHTDVEIQVLRRQQDETGLTLRSYRVAAIRLDSGAEITNFSFSQSLASMQMGYGAILGVSRPSGNSLSYRSTAGAGAGSVAQIISIYWFNGGTVIRISDPLLTSGQALSVNVRNPGIYQIRAVKIANQFRLTQGSPYPRVITPNDPAENNRVFFFFDNPTDETVQGTIYDIRGAKVRDLQVDGLSPTANSLVWDGRDSRGAVVPSGVYLYKVSAGKEKVTGTVVVAR